MAASFIKYHNHLTRRLGRGRSRPDAIARAEANIEAMRDEGVAEIDKRLSEIQAIFKAFRVDPEAAGGPLYDAASTLGGLAPVFGFSAMGSIAYSLCEYLANVEDGGPISNEVVKIHLDGLAVLRSQAELSDVEVAEIVQYLERMVSHVTGKMTGQSHG